MGEKTLKLEDPFVISATQIVHALFGVGFPLYIILYSHSQARKHDAKPTRKGLVVSCEESFLPQNHTNLLGNKGDSEFQHQHVQVSC